MKYAKEELKIEFLELNWEDIISYVIKEDDLVQCARFIHQARSSGGSVLVHCIQVKSQHRNFLAVFTPIYTFHLNYDKNSSQVSPLYSELS